MKRLAIIILMVATGMLFAGCENQAADDQKINDVLLIGTMPDPEIPDPDLPVMSINTVNREAVDDKENWIPASMSITNADEEYCRDGLALSIKGRGNTTWRLPKKPYALKLDKRGEIMGMPEHKRWVLLANYSDKTLIRNDIAFHMGCNIYSNMAWTPSARHIILYLNNKLCGEYLLTEQIEIEKNRVDITSVEDDATGGYLLEVNFRLDETLNFTTTRGIPFSLKDPDEYTGEFDESVWAGIQAHVQNVEDVLFSDTFTDPDTGYRKYLDVDSFIDWYLVNEITKNNDAIFFSSCYMYYDPSDAKLHMGPLWDFDISSGNISYNGCDETSGFWVTNAQWINRMFKDPAFVQAVQDRWTAKKSELDAVVDSYIDEQASYLAIGQEINFIRWRILGRYVWPNADGYRKRKTYESEIEYLKNWLSARIDWLDTAISEL